MAREELGDKSNINLSTYDLPSIYVIPRYGHLKHWQTSGILYIWVLTNLVRAYHAVSSWGDISIFCATNNAWVCLSELAMQSENTHILAGNPDGQKPAGSAVCE